MGDDYVFIAETQMDDAEDRANVHGNPFADTPGTQDPAGVPSTPVPELLPSPSRLVATDSPPSLDFAAGVLMHSVLVYMPSGKVREVPVGIGRQQGSSLDLTRQLRPNIHRYLTQIGLIVDAHQLRFLVEVSDPAAQRNHPAVRPTSPSGIGAREIVCRLVPISAS